MERIATASCTIVCTVDVGGVTTYYRLQQSTVPAPDRPSVESPSGWTTTEPGYDGTSTNTLYTCPKTTLTDGSFSWGDVSVSSSYEAAKVAYNEAQAATRTATSFISELANGIFVHPSGDSTTGWRIADVLEMLKSGVSAFRVWLESDMAKVRIGEAAKSHMLLDGSSMKLMDGRGESDAYSVAALGPDGSRIGYSNEGHVSLSPRRLAMMFAEDRLFEVSTNGMTTSIYAGGSTKASNATMSNAEFAALYSYLIENGAYVDFVYGSNTYYDFSTHGTVTETYQGVYVLLEDGSLTEYKIDTQAGESIDPRYHDGYAMQYPVTDRNGNKLSCADGEMVFLFYPDDSGQVIFLAANQPQPPRLDIDAYLQPLAEVAGAPVAIKAGGVDAVLANGEIRMSSRIKNMDGNLLYSAADHTHTPASIGAAALGHDHDATYAAIDHDHDATYAAIDHDHDATYAAIDHDHDATYAAIDHAHDAATTSAAGFMSVADKAKLDAVGTRQARDNGTATSMATSTWKSLTYLTLGAGTWVVCGNAQIATNATGRRWAVISDSTDPSANDMRQHGVCGPAASGSSTYLNVCATKVLTTTTTLRLMAWQNSGSTLNGYGCMTAVRIA